MGYMTEDIKSMFNSGFAEYKSKLSSRHQFEEDGSDQILELYLPRKVGKTSAMVQIANELYEAGVYTTFMSFHTELATPVDFFVIDGLDIKEQIYNLMRDEDGIRVILIDEVPLHFIERSLKRSLDRETFVFLVSTDY